MSSIRLKHASGNSMSLAAPGTNPASNLELKLPHTIGSANQLLKVDGSGQLGWADDNSGLSLSNDANNRVVTGTGSGLNAEANLTFDGKTLISASGSYPETTELIREIKGGVAEGNRFSNRYIKIKNTYTGSVHGGIPIVWEANADGSNNKSYGAITTEGDGAIRFLNKAAGSAVSVGTGLGLSERLRITSGGNVGIGTTSPGHILDLYNSNGTDCLRLNVNTGVGGSNKQNAIRFSVDGTVKGHVGLAVDAGKLISGSSANDFCVKTNDANNIIFATNSSERLRITSDGKVGIGTTGPSHLLDVEMGAADYLVYGSNPRLHLRVPDGTNGMKISATTTPLEIKNSDENGRSFGFGSGGAANFDMNINGDYSLSANGYDSSPKLFFNATRHNGSSTVTSFQTSIQAVATSNTNNTGYLGLGSSASPDDLVIKTDGKVGIGTTSPGSKLHLQDGQFTIKSSGECGPYLYRNNGSGPDLVFHSGRGSSFSSPTASGSGDLLGNINFAGYDGSNYLRRATINGFVDGSVSSNTVPTGIYFRTGTTTPAERLRITSGGKIGIATTAPETALQVKAPATYSAGNSGKSIYGIDLHGLANQSSGTYGGAISFSCGGNGRSAIAAIQAGSDDDVNGLAFFTHGSSTGSADTEERCRITASGQYVKYTQHNAANRHKVVETFFEKWAGTSWVDLATVASGVSDGNPHESYYYEIIIYGSDWGSHSGARAVLRGTVNGYNGYGGHTVVEDAGMYGLYDATGSSTSGSKINHQIAWDNNSTSRIQLKLSTGSVTLTGYIKLIGAIRSWTIH